MKKLQVVLGRILIVLGCLLILGALLLSGYNGKLEQNAKIVSASTLEEVQQKIEWNRNTAEKKHISMQEFERGGNSYFGVLEIPRLDLSLPVQADWSYDKLYQSPCVYSGSIQDGELVILAHNYHAHFRNISNLEQGDKILLTDIEGKQFHYVVEEVLLLEAENVKEMTDSGYDLSLFTCSYSGDTRVTVRCTMENEADHYPTTEFVTTDFS